MMGFDSRRLPLLGRWIALVPGVLGCFASCSVAAIHCETSGGPPGEEIVVRIDLPSNDPSEVLPPEHACERPYQINGTFQVEGPLYDYYLVIDQSASTELDSGIDVDGDGILEEPEDSIYYAEIRAAQLLLDRLDPDLFRVALITFSRWASIEHPLSSDFSSLQDVLEALKSAPLGDSTLYVRALDKIQEEHLARGGAGRVQTAFFLSDGRPSDGNSVDRAAEELAALGIRVNTVALGLTAPQKLEDIATITGGSFTDLQIPGEIVEFLPLAAGLFTLEGENRSTAVGGDVSADPAGNTFESWFMLEPGWNEILFTLTVQGETELVLECSLDVFFDVPRPRDVGNRLRVLREDGRALFTWPGAEPLEADQVRSLFRSGPGVGYQYVLSTDSDAELAVPMPISRAVWWDLRTQSCAAKTSPDPYEAWTHVLDTCWSPPEIPAGFALGSNLTDGPCPNAYDSHRCDPARPPVPYEGTDRTFRIRLEATGWLDVELSEPGLFAGLYSLTGECIAGGQGGFRSHVPAAGPYDLVVDSIPGGETAFELRVDLDRD